MKYQRSLCWLRRDLRLKDHVALYEACRLSQEVVVVFVFDTTILNKLKNKKDRRVTFIHQSLQEVGKKTHEKGSSLVVLHGNPIQEIPELAHRIKAQAVFTNRDYEPAAKKRDKAVLAACRSKGIEYHDFKDQVIFEGEELSTQSGTPFKVYTPYKKAWLKELNPVHHHNHSPKLNRLLPAKHLKNYQRDWTLKKLGFESAELWLPSGETGAAKQLKQFLPHLTNYDQNRDYPSLPHGTSGLSVHLRFGTLSIRSLVRLALDIPGSGAQTWLSELIWRDFYQMILDRFPYVVKGCFKKEYDRIQWPGHNTHFNAWCDGQTGFPLIDAAMRSFEQTGWMHNRLRMVVASFLTKDLLVDWRKGEQWFADNLLDFDLSANNGGWQWCASTGCDAQPYFRIFNPVTQSKKFDPEGRFIREQLPELSGFSNKRIHWPHEASNEEQEQAGCILGKDYTKPVVVHSQQRIRAIDLFKQ
jgi:deoxyribodipyrimidine photo-lyase